QGRRRRQRRPWRYQRRPGAGGRGWPVHRGRRGLPRPLHAGERHPQQRLHQRQRYPRLVHALPLKRNPPPPPRSVCAPEHRAHLGTADRLPGKDTRAMLFTSLLRKTYKNAAAKRRPFVPRLESLEERTVLSTLTVLNNLDKGAGSLRDTITNAKDGDTIVFAPSLTGQTITLTSDQLTINKSLD